MTNEHESVYESSPCSLQESVAALINDINDELIRLLTIFDEHHFSVITPLLVDALTNLEDSVKVNNELTCHIKELKSDLKCLEEQYEKEKLSRKYFEDKLLKNDFENEDEIITLNDIIKYKDKKINKLLIEIKELNAELLDKPSVCERESIEIKSSYIELISERNMLLQKINELELALKEKKFENVKTSLSRFFNDNWNGSIQKANELILAKPNFNFSANDTSVEHENISDILSIPNFIFQSVKVMVINIVNGHVRIIYFSKKWYHCL